jgi:hypothetical protein
MFLTIFSKPQIRLFVSRFFSAAKKDFFKESENGHLLFFKNVQNAKVIRSLVKNPGIKA